MSDEADPGDGTERPSAARSRTTVRSLAALVVLLLGAGACAGPPPTPPPATPTPPAAAATPTPAGETTPAARAPGARAVVDGPVGRFPVERAPEASGLAVSRRNADMVWLVSDGPGTRSLLAVPIDPSGRSGGGAARTVEVPGLDAVDAEALAVGDCAADDPRPCVFVGDIGDNRRARDAVRIHRVVEPDLSTSSADGQPVTDSVRVTYPDGPTDAEAMFVQSGRVFIVSKAAHDAATGRTGATRLYELPTFVDGVLRSHGTVPVPDPSTSIVSAVTGTVVTGADAVAGRVVLRTYDHAVRFDAPERGADPASFPTWPFTEVPTDGPLQTEAVAFAPDGCATLTAGEGDPHVWRTPCPEAR